MRRASRARRRSRPRSKQGARAKICRLLRFPSSVSLLGEGIHGRAISKRRMDTAVFVQSAAAFSLRRRWAALAARMRCSRRSGVILYSYDNGHFMAYTSPPPAAEPLLKEKPLGGCTLQLSPIAAPDSRTQSATPWHADFNRRRACAARPKGESRKRTEESLLSSGRFRLSPALRSGQGHSLFSSN